MKRARPSDSDTFLLPLKEREVAFTESLFAILNVQCSVASVEGEWPDCNTIIAEKSIGVELTQPNLFRQKSDLNRIFEQISYASYNMFCSLQGSDCRVVIEFVESVEPKSFGRNFSAESFVKQIAALLKCASKIQGHEKIQFSIYPKGPHAIVYDEQGCGQFCTPDALEDFATIKAIYISSENGRCDRPFISVENSNTSWEKCDQLINRARILSTISKKNIKKNKHEEKHGSTFSETWLVIHYPGLGSSSFRAGNIVDWEIPGSTFEVNNFKRIFLLGLGAWYELSAKKKRWLPLIPAQAGIQSD